MKVLEPDRLPDLTGGTWLRPPADGPPPVGVGIDTRADLAGRAFVAIRGQRHDGHDHVEAAARGGARVIVVERPPATGAQTGSAGVLLVGSTRRALADLARAHRREAGDLLVVGVTGSSGKTTTRQLVHAALGADRPGTAAPRSFNNDIGVPLTLLAVRPNDRYVVCEIGTSAPGEIGPLSRIAEPDVCVLTTIGPAHLEAFGSLEAIAREKCSILDGHTGRGPVVARSDDPLLRGGLGGRDDVIWFGADERADVQVRGWAPEGPGGSRMDVEGLGTFVVPLPGEHNVLNALAAIAVARSAGASIASIRRGLAAATGIEGRLTVRPVAGRIVVDDAWNANPQSMRAALATLPAIEPDFTGRRVAVLGEMLELGPDGPAMHAELGRSIADLARAGGLDAAILVGPLMAGAAETARAAAPGLTVLELPDLEDEARARLVAAIGPSDLVLLKGSRRWRLERVVEWIAGTADPSAPATTARSRERRG